MNPLAVRHLLHRQAQLSGSESVAHDLVLQHLNRLHPSYVATRVGGTYGVLAVWGEDRTKPTVAFRADTDALPIEETGTLEYRSQNVGVSHKCGHDGHTATLLEFASRVDLWNTSFRSSSREPMCNVLLLFQPEEETGRGAQKILSSGLLQRYDIKGFYAMHNVPGYELGTVVVADSIFAAASSGFEVNFVGRQTHASTPEAGLCPDLAVAEMLQRIRGLNEGHPASSADKERFAQSTAICVNMGDEAYGTAAGRAKVAFTLRAFSNSRMKQLLEEADVLALTVASQYHLQCTTTLHEPFPAVENDVRQVEMVRQAAAAVGCRVEERDVPFRWSEDFAHYLFSFPGAFFGVGAGVDHAELHHPDYDFPDELLDTVASLFFQIVLDFNSKCQS